MEVYDVAIVPLIVGLVELVKRLGLNPKYCPAVSVILGILVGCLYVSPDNILEGLIVGVSLGLGAVGLYSSGKNTKEIFDR